MTKLELTRRQLLKSLGGGLLVFALGAPACALQGGESGRGGRGQRGGSQVPQDVSAWIHIGADGAITVFTGKVEVGQNARTNLTQCVAEELRVPLEAVQMVMGDTDLCPFDMGTFGSRTTPQMVPQLRRAAATCREALIDLAAQKWSVNRTALRAEGGKVSRTDGSASAEASYGELAKGQPLEKPIPNDIALTRTNEWKVMGQSVEKVAAREIVTGAHKYSIDLSRPNMLHARVLRPPSYGAKLMQSDVTKAEALPGVKVVRDGDFLAVAAPTPRLARKALEAVRAEWKEEGGPSSKELFESIRPTGSPRPATPMAAKRLDARYHAHYIAHTPLEPRAALAEWDGQKLTVHTGTQRPFGVRGEVAEATGLPESQVRVIVPDTGSGYGGKHTGDAAVEAARIAKALGVPIKLAWDRAEEFMFAYFRPAGVVEVQAGARDDGKLTYWMFDNYASGGAGIGMPYEVSDPKTQSRQGFSPLRTGSYRGLAATFNNFARESAIDELAYACRIDPLEFRLKNLRNERLIAVLRAAAERFGWDKKPAEGRGYGIGCGTEKGGFIATLAEVQADRSSGQIKVIRVVNAHECGAIVNPKHLENQVDGCVLQGLGGALFEAIQFEGGKLLNGQMAQYRVPRYPDMPSMETILLDRKDLPSAGAGECAIIGIAPAIANAVFAATGEWLRELPLRF